MKIMWLLAGITFCDSVDMSIGGPIGAVLQDEGFMTLEQFAFFNPSPWLAIPHWWSYVGMGIRRFWP